jgi:hypothetical protein
MRPSNWEMTEQSSVQPDGVLSSNFVSQAIDFRQKETPDGKSSPRKEPIEEKNIDE